MTYSPFLPKVLSYLHGELLACVTNNTISLMCGRILHLHPNIMTHAMKKIMYGGLKKNQGPSAPNRRKFDVV